MMRKAMMINNKIDVPIESINKFQNFTKIKTTIYNDSILNVAYNSNFTLFLTKRHHYGRSIFTI